MKLNPKYLTHKTKGEHYIISTSGTKFTGIIKNNETAAFIVECLKTDTTESAVVDKLLAKYDVDRPTAEKDVANIIITNEDATDILVATVHEHLTELSEEQLKQFHNKLIGVIWDSTVDRYEKDVYDRLNEPFPMDDEV